MLLKMAFTQETSHGVLLKAGHLSEDILTDYLYNAEDDTFTTLPSTRVDTKNTHGYWFGFETETQRITPVFKAKS